VIARPTVGRDLATRLGPDRYEIHRSPDLESAVEVIRRLRPHLVVAALHAGTLTSSQIVDPIRAYIAGMPVLILTSDRPSLTDTSVVELPAHVGSEELNCAASALLGKRDRVDRGARPNMTF
jgi:DNA-binding response OmpR family regulator